MRRGRNSYGSKGVRSVIAWTFLALLLLRAAIPVGFMPDLDALRDGRIEIVVCTPSGLKTVTVSPDPGDGEQRSSETASILECPFHVVAAQALLGPDLRLGDRRAVWNVDLPKPATVDFPVAAALGPPVGTRAPPHRIA